MKDFLLVMIAAASVLVAQQTLGDLGVKEFQALLNGSPADMERLEKMVADAIAADPKAAFPRFMRGVVGFSHAGSASKQGDMVTAGKLFQSSIVEMDAAVRQEPDSIAIRAPHGAMLITASRSMPAAMGKPLVASGVADFERVLTLQEKDGSFKTLSNHKRGELLTGLADGWDRLGDEKKARQYFERIVKEMPGTVYQTRAQAWLDGQPESKSPEFFGCVGCHVSN